MRNRRDHARYPVVLMLAVAAVIIGTTPFLTSSGLASAQAAAPSWSFTGSLNTPRSGYTATLLPNGKVLVTGGSNADGILASSELYDPSTGTWSSTGNLNAPRIFHSATLLQNGKVLVAGGWANSCCTEVPDNTTELYDPVTGRWSLTGNLNARRVAHTATLLSNGKVLFAGGGLGGAFSATSTAELYNPGTGTWSFTGSLNGTRVGHAATLLQDGKVLVVGGCGDEECFFELGSAELYDPNTGAWSNTGSLNTVRYIVSAATLPNGNVLVAGGAGGSDNFALNSAELYSPATGGWSYTGSLLSLRSGATATLLPSGQVLVAAGANNYDPGGPAVFSSAELYDPATGNWHATASLNTERFGHTATLLLNGKVLVVGGYRKPDNTPLQSAELYDSGSSSTFSPTPTPTATPTPTPTPTATPTLRANGKIAFTSDRDGNREIYVMNADGTNQVRLTNNSVVDDHPTWSPDGTKIAFVSERPTGGFALSFMNADGTNKTEITPIIFDSGYPIWDGWSMSWSPDGNRIVFQEKPDPGISAFHIFIVNIDGSDRHVLINGLEGDGRQPSWSPDGSRILFSKQVSTFFHNLFTVRPDGIDLQPLAGFSGESDLSPTWSPTGEKIAFQTVDLANLSNICIANADGSDRDWFDNGSAGPDLGSRDKPDWSPDGSKIVFHVVGYFYPPERGTQIYVKNVDGTGLTRLTNLPGNNFKPSWQPLVLGACPNLIDCADFFVRQHYRDFLNREPDSPGLAHWAGEISACDDPSRRQLGESLALCIERKRTNTSAAFFLSPEFQYTGYFVYRLYKGSLIKNGAGRFPTYDEFMKDARQVAAGIIQNNQLSASAIEQNKKTYAEEFTKRTEFRTLYDPLSNFDYVEQLFQTTGISVSVQEKQALVQGLNNQTDTRASVLQKIVDGTVVIAEGHQQFTTQYGQAFYEKEFNAAFVLMEYFGYLQRNPDAAGYQHWLDKLNHYGNYMDAEMVRSFILSPEYRARFGQP